MWTLRCFITCVHRCSLSWVELLRKFSAAQACTDRQLAVQTDGYVAAESIIRVINRCFVVMARRKVIFTCIFCDKHCTSDTIECSACNGRVHRVCASMTHDEYQQFSANGMVRSGSMRSRVVRCCPMCSDVVPRSPMWPDVVISHTPLDIIRWGVL